MVTLLALAALLYGLTTIDFMQGLPRVMLWSMLIVLTPYIWFLPYAIVDQRSQQADPPLMQLAVLRPFWSPTYLPTVRQGGGIPAQEIIQDSQGLGYHTA